MEAIAPPFTESTSREPLAYRLDDACRAVGISKSSLYALARDGQIKLIRIAGRSLVEGASLRRLVAEAAALT